MKYAQIVVGAGYGDCGKGLMTDYFCHHHQDSNPLVIRYNGGAQAGHSVQEPTGYKHVFSHFGSGTLLKVPTYLAKDFIVNPIMFNKEYDTLEIYHPVIYLHPHSMITTPYDILLNQIIENSRTIKHGSCGLGIFSTIRRHEFIPITVRSLQDITVIQLNDLLEKVKQYVITKLMLLDIEITKDITDLLELPILIPFYKDLELMFARSSIMNYTTIIHDFDVYIFESAQGLLLSEKHGKFPHLTPSDPGISVPLKICEEMSIKDVNVCYVTRCYTTRHGNGPLENEKTLEEMGLNVQNETNVTNEFQGHFRYAPLDVKSIKKAINNDFKQSKDFPGNVTNQLAITCMDQLPSYNTDGLNVVHLENIKKNLGIDTGFYSIGPTRNNVHKM